MYLSDGFVDKKYVVEKIEGNAYLKNMVMRKSIQKGRVIKLIRKGNVYPYIIDVEGMLIALDKNLAMKIMVIPYV